jgi:acetoin utilization protein AcuB
MSRDPITISPNALLEEAAIAMRDNKIEMLPVVDEGHLVGVVTESAILDAFIELLGFREKGTRLTLDAVDLPGVLAQLGQITGAHRANIQHIAVFRGQENATIVLGVNTLNTEGLERDLADGGFVVKSKLVNP